MPIDFTCPHCGARAQVSDELAGQRGMCQQCGQSILYPVYGAGGAVAMAPQRSNLPWILLAIAVAGGFFLLVCGGVLLALLLPAVNAAREAARNVQCKNNLKQIALALQEYHAVYNSFPPAYIADANGNPMHSWRVLILPFMEQRALFDQYDFNEPWNGPNNQRLASQMPAQFRCPSAKNSAPDCTSYIGSTGPGRLFDPARTNSMQDVQDGISNTIALIEVPDSNISWLDPLDGQSGGATSPAVGTRSSHPRGTNVAMADGSVQFITEGTGLPIVEALQTIQGNEQIGADALSPVP